MGVADGLSQYPQHSATCRRILLVRLGKPWTWIAMLVAGGRANSWESTAVVTDKPTRSPSCGRHALRNFDPGQATLGKAIKLTLSAVLHMCVLVA